MVPAVVANGGKESIEEVEYEVFIRFRFYRGPSRGGFVNHY